MKWRIMEKRSVPSPWPFHVQRQEDAHSPWVTLAMERTYQKAWTTLHAIAWAERERDEATERLN